MAGERTLSILTTWLGRVVPLVLFVVGMYSVPWSLAGPDRDLLPGPEVNSLQDMHALEHFHAWAMGRTSTYWDAPFTYPAPDALARYQAHTGTAWVHALLRSCGFETSGAFFGWLMVLFALNFWSATCAFRAWCGHWAVAASAAYIYAFGIAPLAQLGELHLLAKFMAPWALLAFQRFLHTGSVRWWYFALFALVFQWYCSPALGGTLVFAWLCLSMAYRWSKAARPTFAPGTGRAVLLGSLAALCSLLPIWVPAIAITADTDPYPIQAFLRTVPDPTAHFRAHLSAISWASLTVAQATDIAPAALPAYFAGALPWSAVLVAMLLWWRQRRTPEGQLLGALLLGLSLFLFLPLRIGDHSFMALFHRIPGPSNMVSAACIATIGGLLFLVVLIRIASRAVARPIAALLITLVLPIASWLDNKADTSSVVRYDRKVADAKVLAVEEDIRAAVITDALPAAIAYGPMIGTRGTTTERGGGPDTLHVRAMLAAQRIGVAVVNGPSVCAPRALLPFLTTPGPVSLRHWLSAEPASQDVLLVDGLPAPMMVKDTVQLVLPDGRLLAVGTSIHDPLRLEEQGARAFVCFVRLQDANGRWSFLAPHGGFLSAETHHEGFVTSSALRLGYMGQFQPLPRPDGTVVLSTQDHRMLKLDGDRLMATGDTATGLPFLMRPCR